jgi:hypothetical protein
MINGGRFNMRLAFVNAFNLISSAMIHFSIRVLGQLVSAAVGCFTFFNLEINYFFTRFLLFSTMDSRLAAILQ